VLILNGCGSSSSSTAEKKPSNLSVNNIEAGSTILLQLNNSDSIESYTWWDQNGSLLGNTPTVEWKAPNTAGKYTITVDTVDTKGKKRTSDVVITVTKKVSTGDYPVLTLNGDENLSLTQGDNYVELGAYAIDTEDGNITDEIIITGSVDTTTVGKYTITYSVSDSTGNSTTKMRNVTVLKPTFTGEFADIKQLLQDSKDGLVSDVTYICVGDSTRAKSDVTHAEHLFNTISDKLDGYNVNSILKARGSHTLREFLDESNTPTISDVISKIPGDGSTTILDMSLGYNDFPYETELAKESHQDEVKDIIKDRLIEAIDKILEAKPNTHIYLTSPNPNYNWDLPTRVVQKAYHEVADEMNLPFVDFVSNLMNGYIGYEASYNNWYIDNVHFSTYGLDLVSDYIFSKILP
jgi:hypothetical protein